jgi:hypothetical protein
MRHTNCIRLGTFRPIFKQTIRESFFTKLNMKSLLTFISSASIAIVAQASSFTFQPSDNNSGARNDLNDLDHKSAYTWGITGTAETNLRNELLSGDYYISSAVLSIANIYNWDKRDTNNQLFIHLLDNPKTGVKAITDDPTDNGINQGVLSDYFAGPLSTNKVSGKYVAYGYKNTSTAQLIFTGSNTNTYLTQYHDADGPQTKENFTFSLNNILLAVLTQYITNGHTQGSNYADFGLRLRSRTTAPPWPFSAPPSSAWLLSAARPPAAEPISEIICSKPRPKRRGFLSAGFECVPSNCAPTASRLSAQ